MPTATDSKDYYAILGVNKTATSADIKRAYRQLARKYHPDLNPGDKDTEAKFKDINEANEVLSDTEKREKYDQYLNQPIPSQRTPTTTDDFDQYGDFESFINDLMGRGARSYSRQTSQAPAPDTEAAITLTFSEAFAGVQKRLQLDDETINVRIPAGAKPGSRIRIKGKGRPSPFSQQRGDLYLTIDILPHPFFRFEGDDLVCDVPLRPDEAVLGTEITVPTPDGSVMLKVPKGIRSGQSLRLRNKGWTLPKEGRGDLLVKLEIVTPQELSPLEQEYYEKIKANSKFNPRTDLEEIKL